jgi:hypothetical protein
MANTFDQSHNWLASRSLGQAVKLGQRLVKLAQLDPDLAQLLGETAPVNPGPGCTVLGEGFSMAGSLLLLRHKDKPGRTGVQ